MNLWAVFLTGLLTGGLSCMAVQGGLLATTIAQREEERLKSGLKASGNAQPIIFFLAAKLLAYTVLGFLLGALGSAFELSVTAKAFLQIAVAIFMIGTALNLLEVHPIFRYFALQPPKFLTRLIRNQSKSQDFFAPAILGAFTIFIPCGTTQAMMALAIASGNPLAGAAILFAFVLGTSPVFFVLGYLATKLGEAMQKKFFKVAAVTIMLLAVYNLNGGLALAGSSFTVEAIWNEVYCTVSFCSNSPSLVHNLPGGGVSDNVTISIGPRGYQADSTVIKAGSQVKLHLVNNGGRGCIQAFTIPVLGIQKIVPMGTTSDLTFTAPSQPGELAYMCSMGMYRGKLTVI